MSKPVEDKGGLSARVGDARYVHRVFDQMPLIVLGTRGPEHRIAATTATYRAWAGRQDMVGKLVTESWAEIAGQQIWPIFDRVYATGRAESMREFRIQFTLPETGERKEVFNDFSVTPVRGPDGQVAGLIVVAMDRTEEVRARRAAQQRAVEAERRYEQARDVIEALQRELLPAGLPVLPGVQIAASYLLADADTAAGGDWYDAVPLPGGRVALVVGDVVGHGVAASATMGRLQTVLHERLAAGADLAAALTALDSAATRIGGARAATACVVVLDPTTGAVEYCTAGHPPPLVLTPTGKSRYLAPTGAGPLGVGKTFTAATVAGDRLDVGELVLLHTDGILERPGREPAQSTIELAQTAADVAANRALRDDTASTAERVCTQTLELLVRLTGHRDDITLLAAQRRLPPPPLRLVNPGVGVARHAVELWTALAGAGPDDQVALAHVLVELLANAVEHGDGTVTASVELGDDGRAVVTVADEGRWRERARPGDERYRRDHGFGLAMAASFADDLRVDRRDDGTAVTAYRALSHPARLSADQGGHGRHGAPTREPDLVVLDQPDAPSSRIAIRGPLDGSTVEDLGVELDRYTLGGTHQVIVDLTGVTHLASAAVAELYRTAPDGESRRHPLRLYAPVGSTAHHVLTLVGLPYTADDPHAPPPDLPADPDPR